MVQGEYDVAPCVAHSTVGSCVDKVATEMTFPLEGDMVFAEGHLHYGGIGINIVREVSPTFLPTRYTVISPTSNSRISSHSVIGPQFHGRQSRTSIRAWLNQPHLSLPYIRRAVRLSATPSPFSAAAVSAKWVTRPVT